MITSEDLTKEFKLFKKKPGLIGTLETFFHREYETKKAVDGVTLNIPKGQIVGLLGPNGAGKTTLIKMFTGIIVPSHGELKVLGHHPWKREKAFRKKIALVMGQKSQLWWDIPAIDSFHLLKRYYEVPEKQFQEKIQVMSELLGVKDQLGVHVRKLSLGERMKMELMASLLHSPEVVFLDEPTIGLDLVAQENIRNFLKEWHKENDTTIVLTSHYMADVAALCSRLILIIDGKIGFDGPLEQFENVLGNKRKVGFTFTKEVQSEDVFLKDFDPVFSEENKKVEISLGAEELREVCAKILQDYPVCDFYSDNLPIENVMKTLMKNPKILRSLENGQSS